MKFKIGDKVRIKKDCFASFPEETHPRGREYLVLETKMIQTVAFPDARQSLSLKDFTQPWIYAHYFDLVDDPYTLDAIVS